MSALEALFRRAPVGIKDLMCSLYGARLHRARYGGGRLQETLEELRREAAMDRSRLAALALERLRETLVHAGRTVPYYRRLFAEAGLEPASMALPAGLSQIPALEKSAVRARPRDFLSDIFRGHRLIGRDTSGTTGSPLRVLADRDSLRRHYAYYARFREWAGSAVGVRRATFNGRVLFPPDRRRPPYWVRDLSERNLLFSVYHIGPETLEAYRRRLVAWSPQELHAYPSAVLPLARYALARGLELPRPLCIILSAETLGDGERQLLERAFHARVHNQYGNAEMTVFAGECERGSMHLDPAYGHAEILDGEPAGPGQTAGELVTTGFVNRAMPLLRYRTGDRVVWTDRPCSCGRAFPVLESIEGRVDDTLVLPDGRLVGRLDPVFKGLASLKEVQLVQPEPSRIVVNVVPDQGYGPASEAALLESLRQRLGREVALEVRTLPWIPRGRGGKFRSVIRGFPLPPDAP